MGKRELVLIAVFAVAGVLLYQFTAPPLQPGQEGFSLGRVFDDVRRGIAGRRASQAVQTNRTETVEPSITELRVNIRVVDLTVVGEDRQDALFELRVESNGANDAEARQLAERTTLKVDHAGSGLAATMDFPREGLQRATLKVHVPRRLALRVESKTGRLDASNVAAVDVKGNRGAARISAIAGDVSMTFRGGEVTVDGVGTLRLDGTAGSGTISHVRGACTLNINRADITAMDIVGPLDVKTVGSEIKLRDITSLKPPFRADMQSGSLDVDGLQTETRIDGRTTEIRVALERAVPVTIDNTGDDIRVTAPAGGYTLDARATEGHVTVEEGTIQPTGDDREQRAQGAVRGGGATLVLRADHGDIIIGKRASAKQ